MATTAPAINDTRMQDKAPRLLPAQAEAGTSVELILWHDARTPARPDADLTVLLRVADDSMPIVQGWWDADCWCLCESGGVAPEGFVLAWAEVKGPTC